MSGYIGTTPTPQSTQARHSYTATASQTTFNTSGYTAGFVDVYLNGVKLIDGTDFTATNGSDVVLTTGAALNDLIEITTFGTFEVADSTFNNTTLKGNVTLKNDTEEDSDGGRASKIIYQGEQSGGEITTLAEIQASHDGSSDDQKGDLIFKTNDGSDGASPTIAMTIDSAQNVGIGTSSPSTRVHIVPPDNTTANKITQSFGSARADGNDVIAGGFDSEFVTRDGNVNTGAFIRVIDTNTNGSFPTTIRGGVLSFGTVDGTTSSSADATERMRILSGGDIIIDGTSTVLDGRITENFAGNARRGMTINDTTSTNTANFLAFAKGGSEIGRVQKNSGADTVNYSTTSDYRLKENEENISDGITRVKQLNPYKFNWKSYPEANKVDGFFAHEVQAVVPEAVNGEKDAVDDNDNINPQGIDQSKLVPLLTAALQEAIAKIETLETKVAALEAE